MEGLSINLRLHIHQEWRDVALNAQFFQIVENSVSADVFTWRDPFPIAYFLHTLLEKVVTVRATLNSNPNVYGDTELTIGEVVGSIDVENVNLIVKQASKELDTINQDLTIPMIKNVAELLAMFKDGVDFVYAQEKGKNYEYKITNEIRQAEYNYFYEDRNAIADRKAKFNEMFQIFQSVGQDPNLSKMID